MPAHLLRGAALRPLIAGVAAALVAAFALSGCDLSGLTGNQCTPQTCDYIVNSLVAVNGASGTQLLADSGNALYTFDGSKWNKVSDETATHRGDLLVSPGFASDKTLFLGNTMSTDGGATWTPLCVITKAISPNFASDHTVFAVDNQGNSGSSSSTSTTSGSTGTSTTAAPSCPSSNGAFYTSTDGGNTWTTQAGPQGAGDPDLFVVSPGFKTDKTIFATFTVNLAPALYKSTDGGSTWNKVLDGRQTVVALSTNYANDQTVIVAGASSAQISTNGGQSWNTIKTPVTPDQIAEFAFSPAYSQDKTIVLVSAAVDNGSSAPHGTYTSTDGGNTWTQSGPVTQRGSNEPAFLFSPNYSSDKTVYTSSLDQGKGPAKSTDLGKTWTPINNGLSLLSGLGG